MSIINYVESILGEGKWNTSETELSFNCPFCHLRGESEDTRYRFSINKHKLVAHCFNCGWSGNIVNVIATLNKISYSEALDIVNVYNDFRPLPQDIFDEVFDELMLSDMDFLEEKKVIPLPEDFTLLSECSTKNPMCKPYFNYAKKRLFTDKQLEMHKVGFCPEGIISYSNEKCITLKHRLIMQAFDDNNNPIYWNARDITGRLKPKSINPPKALNSINKSDVVFNLNNAKKEGACVICEGIFDSLVYNNFGVALFGKTISTRQLIQIVSSGIDTVYVSLDADAMEDALKLCDMLCKHIPNVYLVKIEGGKDPNEIGRKNALNCLAKAEKYDRYTRLKYNLLG